MSKTCTIVVIALAAYYLSSKNELSTAGVNTIFTGGYDSAKLPEYLAVAAIGIGIWELVT